MSPSIFSKPLVIAILALFGGTVAISALDSTPVRADFGDPCKKYKKGSKRWKRCKRIRFTPDTAYETRALASHDERFMAGYWLAKNGHYRRAIAVLETVNDGTDARVLNYIGYATRKLGDVESALGFYRQAVALAPDYTMSRAYMGEAYLALGDEPSARGQLREIANRCGTSCGAFVSLANAFESAGLDSKTRHAL